MGLYQAYRMLCIHSLETGIQPLLSLGIFSVLKWHGREMTVNRKEEES
jgi:hypothetical protein